MKDVWSVRGGGGEAGTWFVGVGWEGSVMVARGR